MDEPLGALDKKLRQEMQIEISRLHRESGITMLYVTHDQEEALTMSDRIVLMKDGRTAQCGTADELYFEPRTPYVADFIGESNLLPGRVTAAEGADLVLDLDGLRMAAPRPAFPVGTGDAITLLIRPELASLSTTASPAHPLAGTLEASLVIAPMSASSSACPPGRSSWSRSSTIAPTGGLPSAPPSSSMARAGCPRPALPVRD